MQGSAGRNSRWVKRCHLIRRLLIRCLFLRLLLAVLVCVLVPVLVVLALLSFIGRLCPSLWSLLLLLGSCSCDVLSLHMGSSVHSHHPIP